MEAAKEKMSFGAQIRSLGPNFWVACSMEILERLAFFGVRAIAPLYLVASAGQNGLGLDYTQKAVIYSTWALLQCLIPMVSGGYTDRYGYRKSLAVAFVINIIGYLGMAQSRTISDALARGGMENAGFWVFLLAACLVGTGTAIFKPPAQGTIAKSTDERTSSMGWGVFYWVVNIGGALAPMGAAMLRVEIDWDNVFYAAAIVTALNFLPAFLLYREPERVEPDADALESKGVVGVFLSSIGTIFQDMRLVVFLGIFSCFWLMFMQLWDLLPNFIDEWVDTSDVAGFFSWFSTSWVLESGQTKPEIILNIDAIAIIALVIPISWLVGKVSKVAAMVVGMIISLVGFVGAGLTNVGILCCWMVFVFAIGEMACSPTFSAYVALIAPKEKKALYMGYSNIPFAIGWVVGGLIGGVMYDHTASKFDLARQYLTDSLKMNGAFVMSADLLPKPRVMEVMAFVGGGGSGAAVEQAVRPFTRQLTDGGHLAAEQTKALVASLDSVIGHPSRDALREATQVLWDLHHPYRVWIYLGAIGLIGTLGMIGFYFATRGKDTQGDKPEDAPA